MSNLVPALDTDDGPVEAETGSGQSLGNCLPDATCTAMSREAESGVRTPERRDMRVRNQATQKRAREIRTSFQQPS
jgi:hypothetical protein